MLLRMVDTVGNREDVEVTTVPRVGELIWRHYNNKDHFFVVKEVMHQLINEHYPAILIEEKGTTYPWPE